MAGVGLARGAISHFHAAAGMQKADQPARHPVAAGSVRGSATGPWHPAMRGRGIAV